MRDTNRIDVYMKELSEIWHKNPDLRFAQMIVNLARGFEIEEQRKLLYYVEDNEFFGALKQYYNYSLPSEDN